MLDFFFKLSDQVLFVISLHVLQIDVTLKLLIVKFTLFDFGTLLIYLKLQLVGFYLVFRLHLV